MRTCETTNNLGYLCSAWAAREPDRLAVIDLHGGRERRFTYGELDARLDRVAAALKAAGLRPGDRLILSIGNRVEFVEAMFGAMRAGVVPVPVNTRQGADVIDYIVFDSGSVGAIVEPAANEAVAGLVNRYGLPVRFLIDGLGGPDWRDYGEAVAAAPRAGTAALPEDAICFQAYTSGSTGRPKGVPLTHAGQIWWLRCLATHWPASPDQRGLAALPLYHKNAMAGVIKPRLFTGGSCVLMPGFEAHAYLEAVARYRCTSLSGVPTVFSLVLQETGLLETLDLSSVQTISIGSAPVQDELHEAVALTFGCAVTQSYGLTEGGPVMFGPPTDGRPVPVGSCGVPWPEGEVRLVDAAGRESDQGELWVRNPGVTPGYHNRPDANAERFVDGWLRTGDLFRRDAEGFHYFMGRTDDMFVCGGENIYPIEVEDRLMRHPAVAEACVVPVPYGAKGEAPVAMVSLVKGASADEAALKAHCLAIGPAYAHPRRIVIVDRLPLSGARKIDRAGIREGMRARCADLA